MLKVLSKSALSLAIAGSLIATGVHYSSNTSETASAKEKTQLSVMEPTKASPELVELAKEKGIDLSKHDAVQKILNARGAKFQQAGDNHVTYKDTGSDVPMLVLLVQFADETAPKGAPKDRVPAKYFDDLIFGSEYNPYELDEFKKFAVSPDGIAAPTDRTMQNIYKENSYGKATLTTQKSLADVGWVTLPNTADYYLGQDNGDFDNENGYAHMGELVSDLIANVDDDLDFTKYAVENEDGELVLPNVFIVHAGTGAEWSRDPAQIWSHKWDLMSALFYGEYYQSGNFDFADQNGDGNVDAKEEAAWIEANKDKWTADGVTIGTYGIQPELGGNIAGFNPVTKQYDGKVTGPYPAQAGVFAHEFGHVLGLPDFYDTDYTSEGIGDFSMMAGGSWLSYPATSSAYSGNTPAGFDPFSKIFLGWSTPQVVKPEDGVKRITLQPVNQAKSDEAFVKMEVPGSNGTEYFLFENIQQVGFNKGYGEMGPDAHGLAAWHVDENIISLYQTAGQRVNNVENWMNKRFQSNQSKVVRDGQGNPVEINHYGLSILQADGQYDLEKYNNRGDAADFFQTGDKLTPNSGNVHTGSYYFWKGNSATPADSGIHVTNIKENEDGSLTADFYYATNESAK